MVCEWLKNKTRFYLLCNYSYILHLLIVKFKEINSKNLHTSACVNRDYGITKQKPKMQKLQRWWNLSKLATNTVASLIFITFSVP